MQARLCLADNDFDASVAWLEDIIAGRHQGIALTVGGAADISRIDSVAFQQLPDMFGPAQGQAVIIPSSPARSVWPLTAISIEWPATAVSKTLASIFSDAGVKRIESNLK